VSEKTHGKQIPVTKQNPGVYGNLRKQSFVGMHQGTLDIHHPCGKEMVIQVMLDITTLARER
jgi:hypothetical protein